MSIHPLLDEFRHEQVLFCRDETSGYRSIIAVHSTVLGPAVGGTRFKPYASESEALIDVLRLSQGMTYKNALAGLPFGGGKAVILHPSEDFDRVALFRSHGRFVERLKGLFRTGEDVGTTPADMEAVALETRFVAGTDATSGDPSPWTALGVFRAMLAGAEFVWGTPDLAGRRVAVEGCGNVGRALVPLLVENGAVVFVSDVFKPNLERVCDRFHVTPLSVEDMASGEFDVFSPCALGGCLDSRRAAEIRVRLIVGAANNQLLDERAGEILWERGIVLVPDFVANAGGVISGGKSLLGWDGETVRAKVHGLFDSAAKVLRAANERNLPPFRAARLAVEEILSARR